MGESKKDALRVNLDSKLKLEFHDSKLVLSYDPGSCIFCEQCVEICPTNSLSMSQIYDMSTSQVEDSWEKLGEFSVHTCEGCKEPFATENHIIWIQSRLEGANITESDKYAIINAFNKSKYFCETCRKEKAREMRSHHIKMFQV